MEKSIKNGKGDSPRNCFSKQYRDNFDEIFGKKDTLSEFKKVKEENIDEIIPTNRKDS